MASAHFDSKCIRHNTAINRKEGCLRCSDDYKIGMTLIGSFFEGQRVYDAHSGVSAIVPFDGIFAFTRHGVFVEGHMNGLLTYEPMQIVEGEGGDKMLSVVRWLNNGDRKQR